MNNKKDFWEKLKSISVMIASIFVPLAVILIGNWYSSALKESEIQVRYVELAVDILKENPSDNKSNMRGWAVDLINSYSEIKIDEQTRNELLKAPLFKEIDDFIIEEYAPYIVGYVIERPDVLNDFKNTINSGNNEAIKQMFSELVIAAYNQIEQKKKELKGLDKKKENTKSKTEIENILKK
ncbi:hypothetical protein [Mesonia maritima]|uniref:Uncharacterized protein n=2 Tax=Mesonia maritima TaxID=1793873 RepID=A0ABU1K828_9FLAO|nr:hypothetical protein [Mesonia maritima]MDR6300632.1 hypothetical protein [Mesonia maritima]